jgi:hypothetical protein
VRDGGSRPPIPAGHETPDSQFTLTEPKTAPWGSGQRETFVAVLAGMFLKEYYRRLRAERGHPKVLTRRSIHGQRKRQVGPKDLVLKLAQPVFEKSQL